MALSLSDFATLHFITKASINTTNPNHIQPAYAAAVAAIWSTGIAYVGPESFTDDRVSVRTMTMRGIILLYSTMMVSIHSVQ